MYVYMCVCVSRSLVSLASLASLVSLASYPPNEAPDADNTALASRMVADYSFTCGSRYLLRVVSTVQEQQWRQQQQQQQQQQEQEQQRRRRGVPQSFMYHFTQHAKADTSPAVWGITHGSEVSLNLFFVTQAVQVHRGRCRVAVLYTIPGKGTIRVTLTLTLTI